MSHPWDSLVVGGTDRPRILTIDENFCSNSYFNEQLTTGYVKTGSGTFNAILEADAIGEYMGKILYSGSGITTVDYEYDYGSPVNNKMFLIILRIKSAYTCTIKISSTVEHAATDIPASTETKTYFLIGTITGGSGNSIFFRIQGTDDIDIKFDNLYLTEILADYSFPQPQESSLEFAKSMDGENTLWNGKHQQFNFKYKPSYYCRYDYLNAAYEIYRQEISFNKILFCIPHLDIGWGFLAYWPKDFQRNYSFNRFIGHRGTIMLEGIEYVYDLPTEMSSNILYIYEEEVIII